MILSQEAQIWLIKKVKSDIIGLCCDIANKDVERHSTGSELNDIKAFIKLKFLIKNFGEFIDVNGLVDEWSQSGGGEISHWNSPDSIKAFKRYILTANRESKLNQVIYE